MYSTSKRNYRNVKFIIDIANMIITALMVVLAILSVFKVYKPLFFFPAIFYLGAVMNGLTALRMFIVDRKAYGVVCAVAAAAVLAFAIFTTFVFWI